jgi:V8-like Glu-specific endopeptidase
MKMRALLALIPVVVLAGCIRDADLLRSVHKDTLHLVMKVPEGAEFCSATAIGPNAFLSATHCFKDYSSLQVNGKVVKVLKEVDDGNDHTIMYVDTTFVEWAHVGDPSKMQQGDKVFIVGNPGYLEDMFRKGVLSGYTTDQFGGVGQTLTAYDLNSWPGDSGSAIFNEYGEIVGVLSVGISYQPDAEARLAGSYEWKFSKAQWKSAEQ